MSSFILSHITLFWFILGILLIIFELAVPGGFVLLLMGLAAWTVSIVTLLLHVSITMQIILFVIASLMYLLLIKENLKSLLHRIDHDHDDPENEFVGKKGVAITTIDQAQGKVEFKGTQWPAKSDQPIQPGEEVEILEQNSITLFVKSYKS